MKFVSFTPAVPLRAAAVLGQPAEVRAVPAAGGEPPLGAALAPLSADEAADYGTWGPKEKVLFLMGYQWMAAVTAPALKRADGSPFVGVLPEFADAAFAALKAAEPYFPKLPADMAKAADEATSVVWDARVRTEARGRDAAKKYRLLRDRVAWELAVDGVTVEFEVVGDDPANPGVIFRRKIGEDRAADVSAVFSTKTPKELWEDGLRLQDRYGDAGVVFKRLDMSGTGRRMGAGPATVLVVVIGVVVLVLGFFWLWHHIQERKRLSALAVDMITGDPNLSAVEKADRIRRIRDADSMWSSIFGSGGVPWGSIILGAAVIGVAFFLVPSLVSGGGSA